MSQQILWKTSAEATLDTEEILNRVVVFTVCETPGPLIAGIADLAVIKLVNGIIKPPDELPALRKARLVFIFGRHVAIPDPGKNIDPEIFTADQRL